MVNYHENASLFCMFPSPSRAISTDRFVFQLQDMFIILFSSCTSRMPSLNRLFNKGGYQRVGADDRRPNGSARGRTPDDENRLIDQLDEEVSISF